MRVLFCLCLASGLLAGEAPQPGRNEAFLTRVLADSEGGSRPWRAYRLPPESASAVVEVVGELTPEERRQATFQEFLAWFRADLHRFFRRHGGEGFLERSLASATLPVERFGGNPVPRPVPLGRAGF